MKDLEAGKGISSFESSYSRLLEERRGILASEWGGELQWLKDLRERDFGRWATKGLPTRSDERWRYTSVAEIAQAEVTLPAISSTDMGEPCPDKGDASGAVEISFLNGQYRSHLSRFDSNEGLSVEVLSELLDECVNEGWSTERISRFAAFRAHAETSDADRETVFAAINTSFIQDVVLIDVLPGARIEKPIVINFRSEAQVGAVDLPMTTPRVFVHLRRHAEAAILEVHEGPDGQKYFANAVSDLLLEEGARLSHCKLQNDGDAAFHIGTTRVRQHRSSFGETFQISLGAKLSRQDLHISLEGEGAEAALDGLYLVSGRQHVDHHTRVDHAVAHTTSSQLYKGILRDEARAVFNGFVHIHKDAQKSSAIQLNNNLLLGVKAEVDTKPELEIEADDVKASHGATIGRLDQEQIFYLRARGIPEDEAVRMLADGFAQDVLFRISHARLREMLIAKVGRLARMRSQIGPETPPETRPETRPET